MTIDQTSPDKDEINALNAVLLGEHQSFDKTFFDDTADDVIDDVSDDNLDDSFENHGLDDGILSARFKKLQKNCVNKCLGQFVILR